MDKTFKPLDTSHLKYEKITFQKLLFCFIWVREINVCVSISVS